MNINKDLSNTSNTNSDFAIRQTVADRYMSMISALEGLQSLCTAVPLPRTDVEYINFFCGASFDLETIKASEPRRSVLYKNTCSLLENLVSIEELKSIGCIPIDYRNYEDIVQYYVNLSRTIRSNLIVRKSFIDRKKQLDSILQELELLCAEVGPVRDEIEFIDFFCGNSSRIDQFHTLQSRRTSFYKSVSTLVTTYIDISSDFVTAGFEKDQIEEIKKIVDYYSDLRKVIQTQELLQNQLMEERKNLNNTLSELNIFFNKIKNDDDEFEYIMSFLKDSNKSKKIEFDESKFMKFCEYTDKLLSLYMRVRNEIYGGESFQMSMRHVGNRLSFYSNLRIKLTSLKSMSYI